MENYRYYSILRPVGPWTFPKDGAVDIHNFDGVEYVPEIGRNAWGYIVYNRILSQAETYQYDLMGVAV